MDRALPRCIENGLLPGQPPYALGKPAESEMLLCVFILLLITIAMTLSAHATSDRIDMLTPRVDALFQDFNQPGSPGASVMVIKRGKVVLAKGYGLANLEDRVPCGTNTNFRLTSVTKP